MLIQFDHNIRIFVFALLVLISACTSPATQLPIKEDIRPDLETYFQGFDGAFVLYDLKSDRYTRYNPDGCAERLLPASTFKIMNALIALETGVVPDQDFVIPWDGTDYPIAAWNQDHTLKTAFQNSVVWYYAEAAGRIGPQRMQQYIDDVGYGNQTIGDDLFWLDGSLQISADEQVEFLKRLYHNDLPFSKRAMDIVREIMLLETGSEYQLRGKTGSGQSGDLHVGWFVGYVEENENVYFFALNIQGTNPEVTGLKAKEILLQILKERSQWQTSE